MIYLNTDRLVDVVQRLDSASKQIDEAVSILLSIATHDDWCCKERYLINEHILNNRKKVQQLQEKGTNFYSTVKTVVDEFVNTETNISHLFENLDNKLSSILMWNNTSVLDGNVAYVPNSYLEHVTDTLLNPVQESSGLLNPLVLVDLKDYNL